MICRVAVKFSIGSRSVTSSTTCDSLIGEPEKILRTSLTMLSSPNSLPAKLNDIFSAGRRPTAAPASAQTRRIRSRVISRISPLDSASGMKEPGSTSVPSGFLPAHQHFGAAQLAGADIDDRLVIGHEFAGLQRALDLGTGLPRRAPRHQHGEDADDHDDGAGGEHAEPLQFGVAGDHLAARRRDLGVEAEFVRISRWP